jgi:hypothetical protein
MLLHLVLQVLPFCGGQLCLLFLRQNAEPKKLNGARLIGRMSVDAGLALRSMMVQLSPCRSVADH